MTYLQLVNDVLVRLREAEVTAVTDNAYSKLIGKYINDAKRQVEDAYNWNALSETITVVTSNNLFNYVMTGSGQRFRVLDVRNAESDMFLDYETTHNMNALFNFSTLTEVGSPRLFNFNGVDTNGDTQVDLFPIPNGVYNIYFNIIKPQDSLSNNADVLKIPSEPVLFLAYAKALVERGEDAGLSSAEAYQLFQTSLADHISSEAGRYPDELIWQTN